MGPSLVPQHAPVDARSLSLERTAQCHGHHAAAIVHILRAGLGGTPLAAAVWQAVLPHLALLLACADVSWFIPEPDDPSGEERDDGRTHRLA